MGQKVHPIGWRVGYSLPWNSRWIYKDRALYAQNLNEDILIRKLVKKFLQNALYSTVEIERKSSELIIFINGREIGLITGPNNKNLIELKKQIQAKTTSPKVNIVVRSIKKPDLSAEIVAKVIARGLKRRESFRSLQKKAIMRTMKANAKGIKTLVSGRLNGDDIARSEGYSRGSVSLQTIRAQIDYANVTVNTSYGKLGVKVWIYSEDYRQRRNIKPQNK